MIYTGYLSFLNIYMHWPIEEASRELQESHGFATVRRFREGEEMEDLDNEIIDRLNLFYNSEGKVVDIIIG